MCGVDQDLLRGRHIEAVYVHTKVGCAACVHTQALLGLPLA